MKRKNICFTIILITPILLLAGIAVPVARDIHEIRAIDPADMQKGLAEHLARKAPESFPFPDEFLVQDYTRRTVFVFGASNLVLSEGKGTFPDYLGRDHADLRVVNLGVSGIDSFSIRQRVQEALSLSRPDLMVLYYGDNDYNSAYQGFIVPRYFEKFDFLLRIPYFFYNEKRPVSNFASGEFYWFSRLNRPKLFTFFETLGLIRLDHAAFAPMNRLILDQFILNNEAILDMAVSLRVPVMLMTPAGNLHAEPFGDRETRALYRKGLTTSDYIQSLAYLQQAIDTEIFTYDLRAKSPLYQYVRGIRRPNVYVLDLGKKLEERHFGFGYSDFLDYVHFNDASHRLLADIIYDFMKQKNLIRRNRGTAD